MGRSADGFGFVRELVALHLPEGGRRAAAVAGLMRVLAPMVRLRKSTGIFVFSPRGEGDQLQRALGPRVVTPRDVLDKDTIAEVYASAFEAGRALEEGWSQNGEADDVLNPWALNRTAVQGLVVEMLLAERGILRACRTGRVDRCRIFSASSQQARGLQCSLAENGVPASAHGIPAMPLRRSDGRTRYRWHWDEGLRNKSDGVLLVGESTAMGDMFDAVWTSLPDTVQRATVYLDYSTASSTLVPSPRSRCSLEVSVGHSCPRQEAGETAIAHLLTMISPSLRPTLSEQILARVRSWLPRQLAWSAHVAQVLKTLQPRLVVVGNDRYWSGQAYVRIARAMGLRTLCLQDGIAADEPNWYFCNADAIGAGGELWPRLLRRQGDTGTRAVVTGQPRNDPLARRLMRTRRPSGLRNDSFVTALLVLQEIHSGGYVRAVLEALLVNPSVQVVIRPHPGGAPRRLDRLGASLGTGRVRIQSGGKADDLFDEVDVVVTEYSTVAVEAAAAGVPVIACSLSGRTDPLDLVTHGLGVLATNREQLGTAIRALQDDLRKGVEAALPEGGLLDLLGPVDGHSARRASSLILRELEGV